MGHYIQSVKKDLGQFLLVVQVTSNLKLIPVGKVPTCFYLNHLFPFSLTYEYTVVHALELFMVFIVQAIETIEILICVGLMLLLSSTIITKHVLLLQ